MNAGWAAEQDLLPKTAIVSTSATLSGMANPGVKETLEILTGLTHMALVTDHLDNPIYFLDTLQIY